MFQAQSLGSIVLRTRWAAHSRERSFPRRSSVRHVTIILNNPPTREYKVGSYVNAYPFADLFPLLSATYPLVFTSFSFLSSFWIAPIVLPFFYLLFPSPFIASLSAFDPSILPYLHQRFVWFLFAYRRLLYTTACVLFLLFLIFFFSLLRCGCFLYIFLHFFSANSLFEHTDGLLLLRCDISSYIFFPFSLFVRLIPFFIWFPLVPLFSLFLFVCCYRRWLLLVIGQTFFFLSWIHHAGLRCFTQLDRGGK